MLRAAEFMTSRTVETMRAEAFRPTPRLWRDRRSFWLTRSGAYLSLSKNFSFSRASIKLKSTKFSGLAWGCLGFVQHRFGFLRFGERVGLDKPQRVLISFFEDFGIADTHVFLENVDGETLSGL